jgi:DNA-binding transcriptional ArsR family regulator
VDLVFKALADPSRRSLLDNLFSRDGQTLGELGSTLEMTRFGAMKHLRVLEKAGLVTTRKVGREKLHYLNPVPIQEIHERWVSKYAAPWLSAMSAIKSELEGESGRPPSATAVPSRDRRAATGQVQIKRRINK